MYCSRCESYIPEGLDFTVCPSCNVDLVSVAPPRERLHPPEPPVPVEPPPSLEKKRKRVIPPDQQTQYHLFHAFFYSFFSPGFYFDVAKRWRGACLIYLALLAAVASILFTFRAMGEYDDWQLDHLLPIINRVPALSFQAGKMTMLEKSPLFLRDDSSQTHLAVFDMSPNAAANSESAWAAFGADTLYFHDRERNLKTTLYAPGMNFKMNHEILYFIADQIYRWMPFLLYPFVGSFYWFFLVLIAFFFSWPGMLIAVIAKADLEYSSIFRLAAVALTPVSLLEAVFLLIADVDPTRHLPLLNLLPLAYLIFAIVMIRRKSVRVAV